jgi:arginine decarboxylase
MELSNFFSAAEGRLDRWRTLHRIAKNMVGVDEKDAEALRQEAQTLLADMAPIEDFCGYPGPRLMAQLHERLQTSDWTGFARLVQRISIGLMTNSYRDNSEAWKAEEETDVRSTDMLPPSIGRGQSRKPYFEVLMVSPGERSMWPEIREVFRRLRRVEDPFIYEPVIVGSFEDAVLAMVFNYNLQAVVISDGFGFPSQYNVPALREILLKQVQIGEGLRAATRDLGTTLARMIRRWRPEVDVYLTTDRNVGALAGSDEAAPIRRVFYGAEEPMEIHLSIMEGIKDRYETPYFEPEELCEPAHRHLPRPADRPREVDLQVKLDPRHGRVLWHEPLPRRVVGNHRRPRQPARADRQHQGRPGEGGARPRRRPQLLRHQRHVHIQQDHPPGVARARRHRAD